MKHGKFLIIDCGKSKDATKLLSENCDAWPSLKIFDYAAWAKDDEN